MAVIRVRTSDSLYLTRVMELPFPQEDLHTSMTTPCIFCSSDKSNNRKLGFSQEPEGIESFPLSFLPVPSSRLPRYGHRVVWLLRVRGTVVGDGSRPSLIKYYGPNCATVFESTMENLKLRHPKKDFQDALQNYTKKHQLKSEIPDSRDQGWRPVTVQ